jgi:hypothetical protein
MFEYLLKQKFIPTSKKKTNALFCCASDFFVGLNRFYYFTFVATLGSQAVFHGGVAVYPEPVEESNSYTYSFYSAIN